MTPSDKIPIFERIKSFNNMYGLPAPSVPALLPDTPARLVRFKEIILKEVDEVHDVVGHDDLDTLVNIADWLHDIVVYCLSEAQRYGLPSEAVLSIIMDSNASKLGADGQPIVEDGKVVKGPNYWKPEPKIRELLEALISASQWSERNPNPLPEERA